MEQVPSTLILHRRVVDVAETRLLQLHGEFAETPFTNGSESSPTVPTNKRPMIVPQHSNS
jgi:hypothetical protein